MAQFQLPLSAHGFSKLKKKSTKGKGIAFIFESGAFIFWISKFKKKFQRGKGT